MHGQMSQYSQVLTKLGSTEMEQYKIKDSVHVIQFQLLDVIKMG